MNRYRIMKADEAVFDPEYGWIVPYRVQQQVWGIWPLFKNWIWVTGQHVAVEWQGARTQVKESYEDPINFPSEESALKWITDQRELSNWDEIHWNVVKECKIG